MDAEATAPGPDATLPALDADQVRALGEVGREWDQALGGAVSPPLPVDPSLSRSPAGLEPTRWARLVSVGPRHGSAAELEARSDTGESRSDLGRFGGHVRRVLFGPPLRSTAIAGERMRKLVALPVLSADALSSVAYGPEAMLAILVLGGSGALKWSLPIAAAIGFLMLTVGVSYRQTIKAYPHGGGSYIVATENLGRIAGLVAAAGLMTDYILTVTVSIASGIAAITSAIPALQPDVVPIGVGVIVLLLAGNLRGVRQAGALFALPTYAFILAIAALVIIGLGHAAGRGFHAMSPPKLAGSEGLGLFLLLRAFASGATAMTGIEAISNAVPVFEAVEWRNARTTLNWMVGLLIAMFAGIVVLVHLDGIVPSTSQTVLSQLAHRNFSDGPLYAYTQIATALVLLLAANTAYNDFPRVLFLLARDRQAPQAFLRMGDRLAFNSGIVALSLAAALVLVGFGGQTERLIPLYAVGVFLAFTLSQAGMVVHWWRRRDPHWRKSMAFNAIGCAMSGVVFVIVGVTKFTQGAWVAGAVVLVFSVTALRIRRHFDLAQDALALDGRNVEIPGPATPAARRRPGSDGRAITPATGLSAEAEETPQRVRNLAIVAVATLNRASIRALAYAASLGQPVLAVHVSPTETEAARFRDYWHTWGDHLPLEVVQSPYRALVAPIVAYIESLHDQRPDVTLTVIVPELIVRHWWHRALHDNTAARLRRALKPLPKVVVASVPFHLPS